MSIFTSIESYELTDLINNLFNEPVTKEIKNNNGEIEISLPGVKKDSIEISTPKQNYIRVTAISKKNKKIDKTYVSSVNLKGATADYIDGILYIKPIKNTPEIIKVKVT